MPNDWRYALQNKICTSETWGFQSTFSRIIWSNILKRIPQISWENELLNLSINKRVYQSTYTKTWRKEVFHYRVDLYLWNGCSQEGYWSRLSFNISFLCTLLLCLTWTWDLSFEFLETKDEIFQVSLSFIIFAVRRVLRTDFHVSIPPAALLMHP